MGLAASVVVHSLRPTPEHTVLVVTAARALPGGTTLTPDDLRTVALPDAAVADGSSHDLGAVAGRTLAVAVTEGTVLGVPVLVDETASGPPGTVVAGVRLAEPALASVLAPGMRVDLLAASSSAHLDTTEDAVPATTLAVRALVLPTPQAATADDGFLGTAGRPPSSTDLVLVAVSPTEAALLANVSGREAVSAVVVR